MRVLLAVLLTVVPSPAQTVKVYETDGDQSKLLARQPELSWSTNLPANPPTSTIQVDAVTTFQTMDGFGASLTDSSAWLIANHLDKAQRSALMRDLFDPIQGAGISLLRQPMGASDFSAQGNFTYADQGLDQFSIAPDLKYTVPMLRLALAANPSLRVLALPWSPPAWMKTSGTMNGGAVRTDQFPALAQYFVKFLEAYQAQQVPVYAVSMQNEPLYSTGGYPTATVAAADQAAFIGSYLGPALAEAGFGNTKILAYDHNWDRPDYPQSVLSDTTARQFVAGAAFHCYGGDVSAQSQVKTAYPDKDIWFTECSGTVGSSFAGDLQWNARNLLIGATRNWARSVILWNVALDQNSGPKNGGCDKCRGVVTIDTSVSPPKITHNVEYYVLAHLAKFVRPGAARISTNSGAAGSVMNVAFRNTDGSIALLVLNDSGSPQRFGISWAGKNTSYGLPAGAVATFIWNGQQPAFPSAGVVNAAHPAAGISPGSIISVYGTSLSGATRQAGLLPLPSSMEGSAVVVNNIQAPLIYVSELQINAQIPWETAPGTVDLQVVRGEERQAQTVQVAAAGPALYTIDGTRAAALNEDGSANLPDNGVPAGSVAIVFGTGFGAVTPPIESGDGAPSDPPARLIDAATVEVGGVAVEPDFAGLAPTYAGLWQFNFRVPASTAPGAVPVTISVQGLRSNTVTVYVQ